MTIFTWGFFIGICQSTERYRQGGIERFRHTLRASTKSAASKRVNLEISSTIELIFGDNSVVGGTAGEEDEEGSAREIDEVENRETRGLALLFKQRVERS